MFNLVIKAHASDMKDLILKEAVDKVAERLASEFRDMTCPTHGEHVKVVITATLADGVSFEFFGCCDAFKESVESKLAEHGGMTP